MIRNVLSYLDTIVKKVPDKLAFANEEENFTFQEVHGYSRGIGTCLAQRGCYREPVIVLMERSPRTITTFLGVITAGSFYVPLDVDMPIERMRLILENCKAQWLICDEYTREKAKQLQFGGTICLYEEMIAVSEDAPRLEEIRQKALDIDPIYIVFTSGSTGVPKGVVACHRSVIDYVEQLSDALEFSGDTIFGNQSPLYVDACLKEIYPTIKFGATTHIIPKQLFMFPVKLVEFLNKHKINTICWVVSALTMISSVGTFQTIKPKYLKNIAFGSEVFPMKQFRLWRETLPEAMYTNLYGPTEGTGMCCYYRVERELSQEEPIPIGHPFQNTEILLLDEEGKLAKEGEICIRGTGVTLGYYHNFEKTKEVFVQNPLNHAYPEVIYRTGDIGRYNEYGELVFVSRRDAQIKHMGHRIELGEIEAYVNANEKVKTCAALYEEETAKICLYYVGDISTRELLGQLKEKLPRYMLPNKMEQLEEMPYTPNGKIDRVYLKEKDKEDRKNGRN